MQTSRIKKIALTFLFAVFIIFLVGLSYFLGRSSAKPAETTSPTQTPAENSNTTSPKNPALTSTPNPTPLAKSRIIESAPALDGFRSSSSGGSTGAEIRVGRNSVFVARGFVSFDLTPLPVTAKIVEAKLRLYQAKTTGSPYSAGRLVKLDHLNYGDALNDTDYALAALSSNFSTLSTNSKVEWKEAETTSFVRDDVENGRSLSQFRIHFQTETTAGDVNGDFAYFESAENSLRTGNKPQLVVKYY